MAVPSWRQALREYTENYAEWSITARHITSLDEAEECDIVFYIYVTYKDFPDYPGQAGAYTVAEYQSGSPSLIHIYLSPVVLHGDGHTEWGLPPMRLEIQRFTNRPCPRLRTHAFGKRILDVSTV